ncbi:MAG: hypothetical protein HN542_02815 [Flavobacteriales bacterium]|jgi:hypothetical protein|nr:hypothetical protein [Flavobacteriales bacterium]NCG29709.1 hypothetical protein [Bacteroidota bacterium]MBT3963248.1 hypothetical protein [Flavobacteriales bacterium]MBT4929972.1 hypothetical protein [Flavobacteriales bacterium]MBT5132346.1 hypothetical protein [Flavobacteriales bacterium]
MFINAPRDFFLLIADLIIAFTNYHQEFKEMVREVKDQIHPISSIWFCWFKKAPGISSQLSDGIIRSEVLKTQLFDTNVCSIDDRWSGLKFMRRKELR